MEYITSPPVAARRLPTITRLLSLLCAMLGMVGSSSAQGDIEFWNLTNQDIYDHYDLHYGSNCVSTGQYMPDFACVLANDVTYVSAPSGVFILYLEVSCSCAPGAIVADMDCGEEQEYCECNDQYVMGLSPRGWRIEPY